MWSKHPIVRATLQRVKSRGTLAGLAAAALLSLVAPAPAAATPTANTDAEYQALGRVFPDPLAGCSSSPCSPNAQGNVPAEQFIQIQEFLDSLEYMNQKPFMAPAERWSNYMEVWPLDGKPGDGSGTGLGDDAFPGNNLNELEFDPKAEYQSAGLPTSTLDRKKSDVMVVRVTDESVPDAGKKRYALSLSIHGIERAGIEGGTRAIEDLVTARATGLDDEPVIPREVDPNAPTFAQILRETIIYFTFPNPDGWRRGSVSEGGLFFQRYNGNGVDLNRDWPDIGFSFRPYSGLSEPESRGLAGFFDDVKTSTGDRFDAGDDLHGQPFADALSYTLLPHGSHDFAKDARIRDTAIAIHEASEEALSWSPYIQPNDADPPPCVPGALGDMCGAIYGQTWGTVYDTINYTTTGALGDYFDSSVGLGADGIDNEMSFSHLDKNIVFDPHTEQLHVDGNKTLIYAHLSQLANPRRAALDTPGPNGYVPNVRLKRDAKEFDPGPPPGTSPQTDIVNQPGTPGLGGNVYEFQVERDADTYNGGMRVDATKANVGGVGEGNIYGLKVQCRGCDEHPGVEANDPDVPDDEEWITVTEDYNQSLIYAQSGLTAAVNRPQAFKKDGTPVDWRALAEGPQVAVTFSVDFSSGRATSDGATGGDDPAQLAGYDVANTDFMGQLDPFFTESGDRFSKVDPGSVIAGDQSLDGLRSLVLADDALPGYTGPYRGDPPPPSGAKTADIPISGGDDTVPGASSGAPGTYNDVEFTIGPDALNASMRIRIDWTDPLNDYDMFLFREDENGDRSQVASSTGTQGTTDFEEINVDDPSPGDYVLRVDNWAAAGQADPWSGDITFTQGTPGEDTGTGAFTPAQKDTWFQELRDYVEGGGNLVLTDGAMRGLSELTDIPATAVSRQTVYAGQSSFAATEDDDTTDDPLAENVRQPGSRFNGGDAQKRRQMFEPTPLGFAIQNAGGADESNARQFHVAKDAFEAAGGRVVATSADAGDRDASADFDNVTIGELPLGEGQVRIAGALLPQPTTEFDHPLGLEPFAVTYTGYIVFCNLIDCTVTERSDSAGGSGAGGASGGGSAGPASPNRSATSRARRCLSTLGGVRGKRLGITALGHTRATQRRLLRSPRLRSRRGIDRYCVQGGGTARVGYPTGRLASRVSTRTRRRIRRRAILTLSTSRRFRIRRIRVGSSTRTLRRHLSGERRIRVGRNVWYVARAARSRLVFRTRGSRVRELGLGDRRLTATRGGTVRFLRAWDRRGRAGL